MLCSTRGILFHRINYSESSVIAKIYTEKFGLRTYLVRGAKKPKSGKQRYLQPLALLDLEVYEKEKSEIQNIKEIRFEKIYKSLTTDIVKSSLLLFINELLYKAIREEESNRELFQFIRNGLILLDESETYLNFHLSFAIQLTKFLGFYPKNNYSGNRTFFHLEEGEFQPKSTTDELQLNPRLGRDLSEILKVPLEDHATLQLSNQQRISLLAAMIRFYELHLPGFRNIKSHQILREVLS